LSSIPKKGNHYLKYFLIFLLIVAIALFLNKQTLLTLAGNLLISEDTPQKAEAIVVLNGGVPIRILEAVDLYNSGFGEILIFCKTAESSDYKKLKEYNIYYPVEHDINKQIAEVFEIPSSNIYMVNKKVSSTYGELESIKGFLIDNNIKKIIIVTSKFHTLRARLIANKVLNKDIDFMIIASNYDGYNPKTWWKNRNATRYTISEYLKIFAYYLGDYWRTASNYEFEEYEDSRAYEQR